MARIRLNRNMEDKLLKDAFAEFIFEKETEQKSPETIIYYKGCFKKFFEIMCLDYETFYCSELNLKLILNYTNKLKDTTVSKHTVNTQLRGIRSIVNYCIEQGYTEYFKVKMIKAGESVKESYTPSELRKLLKKPDIKKCEFVEYRSWVMVNTFYGSGQRLSTMLDLKVKDILFDNDLIMFYNNKSQKNNPVPLSSDLRKILKEYISIVKLKNEDYVFCNQFGNKLAKRSLQDAIADYNKSRGVSKTSIHLFRHTFAKDWIVNGGDIFRLQSILGHSSLEVVKLYVRLYAPDLKVDFDNFSPLDNMRKQLNLNEKQKISTKMKE